MAHRTTNYKNKVVFNLPTEKGRKLLGRLALDSRKARRWSRGYVIDLLREVVLLSSGEACTPYIVSNSTLRAFERGEPIRDNRLLISALAELKYISVPSQSEPFTAEELHSISCGTLEPDLGEPDSCNDAAWAEPSDPSLALSSLAS